MVKISIISLIYCSCTYADWIYESVQRFTPMLETGEAEFLFIANDPTEELLIHLEKKKYPFFLNRNEKKTNEELFQMGYGTPEYIHRVYRGFNVGIEKTQGDIVVLLNSDNCASPDWLENLLKYLGPDTIVSSQLAERSHPKYGVFPGAYHCEFGNHPKNFNEMEFLRFVERFKMTGIIEGGAYMPCAVYRENAISVGLYPEGNIAGKAFDDIIEYGDERFFHKLSDAGITHITALDSIVYHFKEGEMEDSTPDDAGYSVGVQSIKKPKYFPLKSITVMPSHGFGYITFDKEFFLIREIRSSVSKTRNRVAKLKNRLGRIKNTLLNKKT
jgi:hypothetical protein